MHINKAHQQTVSDDRISGHRQIYNGNHWNSISCSPSAFMWFILNVMMVYTEWYVVDYHLPNYYAYKTHPEKLRCILM